MMPSIRRSNSEKQEPNRGRPGPDHQLRQQAGHQQVQHTTTRHKTHDADRDTDED